MEFFAEECCGKCAPCREGIEAIINILDGFRKGCGLQRQLKDLEDISQTMQLTSLCGLGQAAPNVVLDTLQYFRDSYQPRIQEVGV
jgi:NADH:ubiquinone oxidoreductase subunit F (NADH-binding)